jgi:hypothetical protein
MDQEQFTTGRFHDENLVDWLVRRGLNAAQVARLLERAHCESSRNDEILA